MIISKGKLIVIYGANNLGKSHQAELLKNALTKKGLPVIRIKYPIYYIEPTGPKVNAVLRLGLKMPEMDIQKLYAQNRIDFEPTLKSFLDHGTWVVAEDYVGTGIAWGVTRGISLEEMEEINKNRLSPDLAILLFGERFRAGIEKASRNENDDELWQKAQQTHLKLGQKYGWKKVYATRDEKKVFQSIWKYVKTLPMKDIHK